MILAVLLAVVGLVLWPLTRIFSPAPSSVLDELHYSIQQEAPYADFQTITKLAETGDAKSKALVVQELMRGDLVQANPKLAAQKAPEAAQAGHPIALYFHQCLVEAGHLKRPFLTGNSQQEWSEIRKRCEANLGEAEIQEIMTRMHWQGLGGLPSNSEIAYQLCSVASSANIPQAWFRRGYFHENGIGGAEWNEELAFECYLNAARLGSAEANHHLAKFYFKGIGTETSRSLGVAHLARAANKKGGKAQRDLTRIEDFGVEEFILSQKPMKLSFSNVKGAYLYNVGDRVTIESELQNGKINAQVVQRKNGKYLIKVVELLGTSEIPACSCTGQVKLTSDSVDKSIWVPQYCIEKNL